MAAKESEPLNVLALHQKWKLDPGYSKRQKASRSLAVVANPPGYSTNVPVGIDSDSSNTDQHLAVKRTWDIALGPLKQVPTNLFIMFMAGNSISIFPIMMVSMMLIRPVKALLSMKAAFRAVQKENLIGEKFVYIFGNVIGILLALYKCSAMGLLPTHQSDWLAFAEIPQRMEYVVGGMSYT
ncbi:hypothetical protein D918_00416 [Trichuris suis]|uniref:ER membrane protein complex subunit 4 n=1 Tax=Trichuris suis TaxID=68888 RepID=A0A085LRC8_9BILA|nr:hypothetical protein M513_11618 [Trichuris suis]KHJ49291.1 hypothetical protein D918_00416 [Trichuris suis]